PRLCPRPACTHSQLARRKRRQFLRYSSSFFFIRPPPRSPLFPYTTLFRSPGAVAALWGEIVPECDQLARLKSSWSGVPASRLHEDRKSTRLNSSHVAISYAVFCLKKKKLKGHIYTLETLGRSHAARPSSWV